MCLHVYRDYVEKKNLEQIDEIDSIYAIMLNDIDMICIFLI